MEPEYSKYTTAELREALDSIDHSAFPERVKQIKLQLAQRVDANKKEIDDVSLTSKEKKLGIQGQVILIITTLFFLWLTLDAVSSGTISIRRSNYMYETSPYMFLTILATYIFAMGACVRRVIQARRSK